MALYVEARREQHNRDTALAWQTANLTRAKKLPNLSRLLIVAPDKKAQTLDEQRQMLKILSQRYGGSVRTLRMDG